MLNELAYKNDVWGVIDKGGITNEGGDAHTIISSYLTNFIPY